MEAGLPTNFIFCIDQDEQGFLWLGTNKGLCRYDGNQFLTLEADKNNPQSLSHNMVRAVLADEGGVLWVGTQGGGLNKYHIATGSFTHYTHDTTDQYSIGHDEILSIQKGKNGLIWIGTEMGLDAFDPQTERFYHFRHDPGNECSLGANAVLSIAKDTSGTIWAGSWNGGLNKLIWNQQIKGLESAYFERYQRQDHSPNRIPSNRICAMSVDGYNRIWVGSYGYGLFALQQADSLHPQAVYSTQRIVGLDRGNKIYTTLIDSKGNLWVGSTEDVMLLQAQSWNFMDRAPTIADLPYQRYVHTHLGVSGLPHGRVRDIFESREGIIWIATEGGLAKYDPKVSLFQSLIQEKKSSDQNHFFQITSSASGELWLGTREGVFQYLPYGKIKARYSYEGNESGLLSNKITALTEDSLRKHLWIATNKGITKADLQTDRLQSHDLKTGTGKKYPYLSCLHLTDSGEVWAGGKSGLYLIPNSLRGEIRYFSHMQQGKTATPLGRINMIVEDREGDFWLGTGEAGLVRARRTTDGNSGFPLLFTPSPRSGEHTK